MNSFSPDIVSEISLFIFYFAPFPRWPHSSRLSPHIYSFIFLSLPCLMFNRYKTKLSPMWANLKWVSKVISCNKATHTLPPALLSESNIVHQIKDSSKVGLLTVDSLTAMLQDVWAKHLLINWMSSDIKSSTLSQFSRCIFFFRRKLQTASEKQKYSGDHLPCEGRGRRQLLLSLSLYFSLSPLLVDLLSEKRFEK